MTSGTELSEADIAYFMRLFDLGYYMGIFTGLMVAPLVASFIRLVWRKIGVRVWRFVYPFRFRVRSARRFRKWVLRQPSVVERRAKGPRMGWRFVRLTPAGRVWREGGAK